MPAQAGIQVGDFHGFRATPALARVARNDG